MINASRCIPLSADLDCDTLEFPAGLAGLRVERGRPVRRWDTMRKGGTEVLAQDESSLRLRASAMSS